MSLNERIVLIMDRSEMNRSEFADKLGIGRPVLSHILSGRNKPSLSVVEKILEQFPDIDPMWLITGNPSPTRSSEDPNLEGLEQTKDRDSSLHLKQNEESSRSKVSEIQPSEEGSERIIIFHSNGTYSEFFPKKRSGQ